MRVLAGVFLVIAPLAPAAAHVVGAEAAAGARLHFHDCFVQGCDATPSPDGDTWEWIG